jgi:hypothetical protein
MNDFKEPNERMQRIMDKDKFFLERYNRVKIDQN